MTEPDLAAAVRAAVTRWMQATPHAGQLAALDDPGILGIALGIAVVTSLQLDAASLCEMRKALSERPYIHLEGVYEVGSLPETPQSFSPVPNEPCCIAGRASALAVHEVLGFETVSYGAENSGELFVNLVAMGGEGKFAEKSIGSMRGHTDAVSFPFRGETDPVHVRTAPSPDVVTLLGFRNPNSVPTTVMILDEVLGRLSTHDVSELKKPQFGVVAQATFRQGTEAELGEVHTVDDVPVLKDVAGVTHVRYSHSCVSANEQSVASAASNRFEGACNQSAVPVIVSPGDILVVSNRIALHGRGVVGGSPGGESRWLMRTYGILQSTVPDSSRHLGDRPRHVLFP